ncbi:Hypothetical predicted protein [Mytilus galloprovincialis]|uniref:B box-type domain-containing protein n=1 Tax=Mytilus galloprovincialis TaxID=29158 RepID=A0A8B6D3B0_MYTGA|nr:Hypothetical predicted protein [Mytilus galloprovincialis]
MNCSQHQDEQLRLFCKECEDIICVQCLLENHQQHKVKGLSESHDIIRNKVNYWCSDNKLATQHDLAETKKQLEEANEKNVQDEAKVEEDIHKCELQWKNKIEIEVNNLLKASKEVFEVSRNQVHSLLDEVKFCENEMENPASEDSLIRLYCSLKKCSINEECLKLNYDKVGPLLQLNAPSGDTLLGCIGEDCGTRNTNDISTQTYNSHELLSDDNTMTEVGKKGLVTMIPLADLVVPVTKIIPVNTSDAWLISDRKLFRLDFSGIQMAAYSEEADDIAVLKNGDLLVLNRTKSFINQIDARGNVTPFTSTDPYMPLCMDYVKSDNSVFIWMSNKDSRQMTVFETNGIKKKSFTLVNSKSESCCMSVHSSNNFSIIYDVEQTTGIRNYVYSYSLEPKNSYSFSGKSGQSPYLQYVCKGLCYDNDGNVLVSDMQFNTIYQLDGKLQFKEIVLDKNDGISSPAAIAYREGQLWIADSKSLRIYDYQTLK